MLSYEQILELIDKLVETPLSEISLAEGEFSLSLKKETKQAETSVTSSLVGAPFVQSYAAPPTVPAQAPSAPVSTAAPAPSNLLDITSPMVGTFYAAPSPDAPSFAQVGQKIKAGDVLCILEAMKMMNEFPSEVNGTVEEVCVKNGQTVEYGQVLFKIKPE